MSKQAGKAIKYQVDRISQGISSGLIVDQNEFRTSNVFLKLKNMAKTQFVTGTTEGAFIDFKKSNFPVQAKDQYYNVLHAYKRKDKVDLMKYLSVPLYDIFKNHLKTGQPLPFTLYDEIINVHLQQARIFSQHKHATNPQQTWHQYTMKYIFLDKATNQEIIQYNVLERRESDKQANQWRICHIDN